MMMSDLVESVVRNPIVEGENRWCVPTYNDYWVYTIGLEFSDDEISMIIVGGPITGEDTVEQTEAPVFNGWMLDDAADPSLRNAMFVEITPAEPSTVYYRVQYPDEVCLKTPFVSWIKYLIFVSDLHHLYHLPLLFARHYPDWRALISNILLSGFRYYII